MPPVLELRDVSISYGAAPVISNITFEAAEGELVILLGESGIGKTSLLRAICGSIPFEGKIQVGGEQVKRVEEGYRNLNCAYVSQEPSLWEHLRAIDNVSLVRRVLSTESKTLARKKAAELLRTLGISDQANQYPNTLSGGQQQRLAIARALAADRSIYLLDEVTSNIDQRRRSDVVGIINSLIGKGKTVVFATHDLTTCNTLDGKRYQVTRHGLLEV